MAGQSWMSHQYHLGFYFWWGIVPMSIWLDIVRPTGWPITIDIAREMRCIEFLRFFFFSEFGILESEFWFLHFSTAEFENNFPTGIFGIENGIGIPLPMGVPEIGTENRNSQPRFNLLFLFLNYPNILCINPGISQRWCNVPVSRHSWCQCWWRCRCCVGITLFFMSSHHCWWTMQSQWESGCVDLKKIKSCVAYLWLTQSFQSNVQMACLNLKWNHIFFEQRLLKNWGIPYSYFLGVLKPRKLFAFL